MVPFIPSCHNSSIPLLCLIHWCCWTGGTQNPIREEQFEYEHDHLKAHCLCSQNKMPLMVSSSVACSLSNNVKSFYFKPNEPAKSKEGFSICYIPWYATKNAIQAGLRYRNWRYSQFVIRSHDNQSINDYTLSLDWGDQDTDGIEDIESPWEGAVIYKRDSSISHLEYCTTLERLGLDKVSSETSRSRAAMMGIRITKAVKDYPLGTPVQISIDVTRKKKKLRLDGIIKTVLSLECNRCGEPAAESVYSNFSLILSEVPIEEPEFINMGVVYGEEKVRSFDIDEGEEDDNDASVDMDDWQYFPPEEKEIDISKHVRDLVHVEITIDSVCDPSCKGLCLKCGTNLNKETCNCSKQEVHKKGIGPLRDLKRQLQPN